MYSSSSNDDYTYRGNRQEDDDYEYDIAPLSNLFAATTISSTPLPPQCQPSPTTGNAIPIVPLPVQYESAPTQLPGRAISIAPLQAPTSSPNKATPITPAPSQYPVAPIPLPNKTASVAALTPQFQPTPTPVPPRRNSYCAPM